MRPLEICHMKRSGKLPEGIYAYDIDKNCWFPVVYFRKSKHAKKGMYIAVLEYLRTRRPNNPTEKQG